MDDVQKNHTVCSTYLCYNTTMREKYFKKWELYAVAAVVVICAAVLLFVLPSKKPGNIAVVTYNGEIVAEIDLSDDGTYHIDGDLPVTLEVADTKIRFVNPQCPDHLCEGFGWIGEEYEYAICMPAKVSVQIKAPPSK